MRFDPPLPTKVANSPIMIERVLDSAGVIVNSEFVTDGVRSQYVSGYARLQPCCTLFISFFSRIDPMRRG
jgi:hypothetical protein